MPILGDMASGGILWALAANVILLSQPILGLAQEQRERERESHGVLFIPCTTHRCRPGAAALGLTLTLAGPKPLLSPVIEDHGPRMSLTL